MAKRTSTLLADERGATAVEYGLIISLIVLAMLAALLQLATVSTGMWDDVSDKVATNSEKARGSN